MGLIVTPFLALLLWNELQKKVEKRPIDSTVIPEPRSIEDVNSSMTNVPHLKKEQEDGEVRRRVYPYSVVDGGVHSVQELRLAIWRDPVVAKHYSSFKLDRARVVEARVDGDFHVSYRKGEEIFWTSKRLKVAKGERLITDGTTFTRTRCANVLSDVPRGRTSPDEPTPEVLNAPVPPPYHFVRFIPPAVIGGGPLDPGEPTPEGTAAPTLPPSEGTPFLPPGAGGPLPPSGPIPFMPPGGSGGPSAPTLPPSGPTLPFLPAVNPGGGPSDPPVPVPEPTTLLLLGSGLLGLWRLRRKFRK